MKPTEVCNLDIAAEELLVHCIPLRTLIIAREQNDLVILTYQPRGIVVNQTRSLELTVAMKLYDVQQGDPYLYSESSPTISTFLCLEYCIVIHHGSRAHIHLLSKILLCPGAYASFITLLNSKSSDHIHNCCPVEPTPCCALNKL